MSRIVVLSFVLLLAVCWSSEESQVQSAEPDAGPAQTNPLTGDEVRPSDARLGSLTLSADSLQASLDRGTEKQTTADA